LNVFDELSWRGLINQTSDDQKLREHLATPGRSLYCGFDPTAESLHIGNLVPLLGLLRFAMAGHKPMFLLGGATGLIGDPSGKDKERVLTTKEKLDASAAKIKSQVEALFEKFQVQDKIEVVNNYDWTKELTAIELLRDIGKHFTINYMLAKDSVKGRINREETGISYTEFSYMILQSYDFYYLSKEKACSLQVGGGDQFGNITAGLELIRRKLGAEAYALTFPLITTASGAKFGKSEQGAIFMDPNLTSPYAFYQYWINADDRDVVNYLKYFTMLDEQAIAGYAAEVADRPHLREAQKKLALDATAMIHGETEAANVVAVSDALFGKGDIKTVDVKTLKAALDAAPSATYDSLDAAPDLPQILADLNLVKSKSEARKAIKAGGLYINNERVADENHALAPADLIGGAIALLRKGKKSYGVVQIGKA
jgi:tyrosyl-tRNA synthetase